MPSTRSLLAVAALAAVASVGLTGCGPSASEEAAQAAYDSCDRPDAKTDLVHLEDETVTIEVTGDTAKALSGGYDAGDNLGTAGELEEGDAAGIGLMIGVVSAVDCMVENTSFPGTSEELRDGDEWDGWRYAEEDGPGSEVVYSFTAES